VKVELGLTYMVPKETHCVTTTDEKGKRMEKKKESAALRFFSRLLQQCLECPDHAWMHK